MNSGLATPQPEKVVFLLQLNHSNHNYLKLFGNRLLSFGNPDHTTSDREPTLSVPELLTRSRDLALVSRIERFQVGNTSRSVRIKQRQVPSIWAEIPLGPNFRTL